MSTHTGTDATIEKPIYEQLTTQHTVPTWENHKHTHGVLSDNPDINERHLIEVMKGLRTGATYPVKTAINPARIPKTLECQTLFDNDGDEACIIQATCVYPSIEFNNITPRMAQRENEGDYLQWYIATANWMKLIYGTFEPREKMVYITFRLLFVSEKYERYDHNAKYSRHATSDIHGTHTTGSTPKSEIKHVPYATDFEVFDEADKQAEAEIEAEISEVFDAYKEVNLDSLEPATNNDPNNPSTNLYKITINKPADPDKHPKFDIELLNPRTPSPPKRDHWTIPWLEFFAGITFGLLITVLILYGIKEIVDYVDSHQSAKPLPAITQPLEPEPSTPEPSENNNAIDQATPADTTAPHPTSDN